MMPLIHGKSITSEEVENAVSRKFTSAEFASLCNAIAWASAGRRCSSLPSFTERVNVKDGGIDAEWETDLPEDGKYSSLLLGPGLNVFQYKLRDIFSQGREKTFNNLAGGLRGAIKELRDRTGRRPKRYILFTNLDLTHFSEAPKHERKGDNVKKKINGQKAKLKRRILEGYDQPDNVEVEIVGAAELAAFLNDLPHLRSAFFVCENFSTWQEAWLAHTREKLIGASVKLVGRDKELADLRSMVEEPNVRAIVLSGPHNIGKTRIALQATDHRPIETVFALDPRSMSVSDLLALLSPSMETIVVIEDPDPDKAEDFVNHALVHSGLKLLITLPTAEYAPSPNFGRDNRVQSYRLSPLSDSQAHELLKAVACNFDYSVESWVIDQAGGNPGILLMAASLGEELRKSTGSFTENVAKAFEKKVRRELGDTAIEILRLLSLLTYVGIKGTYYKEIELICSLFGSGLHPNSVLNALPHLENAGIVKVSGLYVEAHPPIFANTLAVSAIRGVMRNFLLSLPV